MPLHFTIDGLDGLEAASDAVLDLKSAPAQAEFKRRVIDGGLAAFRAHQERHFATEGVSTGAAFRPLKATYRLWKVSRVGFKPILTLTGEMRRAYVLGKGRDANTRRSQRGFFVGVRGEVRERAEWHLDGPRPERPRPPLRFRDDPAALLDRSTLLGSIGQIARDWAEDALKPVAQAAEAGA